MILRPQLNHFLVFVFLCISLSSAWPWPPSLPDIEGLIIRRQDESSSDSAGARKTAAATKTATAKSTAAKVSKTASPASNAASGTTAATASAKASGTKASGSGSKTTGKKAQDTDVDPRLPQGGVNMVTPSALAASTYYKIGVDSVSFAWNYTSLSVTPDKIDILVTCTANQATYTLASNASFEETGSVVWDTRPDETGTAPLLTETYTLVIHDAAKDVTDVASAGQLGKFNQFSFGMYIPQQYTPRAEWKCATCNAALSDTERQAIKFMLAMCGITILSFTWFVGGFWAMI
ncbi:MAG: hypothetical protein Q9217_002294 [Psora testacea]